MTNRILKYLWKSFLTLCVVGLLGILLPRLITAIYSWHRIYQADESPTAQVAIIFGAGLKRDGTPTVILRDRVETGVRLYRDGKVEKLLMSGDNSVEYYNEPEAMRQYALSLGVPDQDIVLDYAGRRTYDTCFRAKAIFGVEKALLVTQKFHLPRALFLCNKLGFTASGVEANNRNYRKISLLIWNFREQLATTVAFLDLFVDKPSPILGLPEPIFVDVEAK
jgi:SanA protein